MLAKLKHTCKTPNLNIEAALQKGDLCEASTVVGSTDNLDRSIKRAEKHYYSLFTMPSYTRIAILTAITCFLSGIVAILPQDFSRNGLFQTLQFSVTFFLLSIVSDVVIRQLPMRSDMIYTTRRCAGLSMFSNLFWIGFLALGSLVISRFWVFWFDLLWICFSAICILRLIVFSATSYSASWRIVFAAYFQPLTCLSLMVYGGLIQFTIPDLLFSIMISFLTASLFITSVDRIGVKYLQMPTTAVLKAILTNWMEGLNGPVENLLESFGGTRNIGFSAIGFGTKTEFKAMIIVPSFHPGPFRNVGSSSLPFMIQKAIEEKLGCFTSVPHGLLGHEFDLSSQAQNQKVLEHILASTNFTMVTHEGTGLMRASAGVASASCQIFGKCAFISLTLAPETTEDFPQEVGDRIHEEAAELGLSHVVTVNAHNSINNPFDVRNALASLNEVALKALRDASQARQHPLEIGVAKVVPREFTVADGMGPGGIGILLIRSNRNVCGYITIDGNNMVSGLRERILETLKDFGINSGEVFTTDTHAVNAVELTTRGYHPIGDVMPHDILLHHIEGGIREALSKMDPVSFGYSVGVVPEVRVIGESQIRKITLLADKALHHAKKIAAPLFGIAGVILIVFHAIL